MTDYTPDEIEEALDALSEDAEDNEESEFYGENMWGMIYDGDGPDTLSLRGEDIPLEHVARYGGEGQGDEFWVVIKLGDQLFKKDGWYASHDGGYLDGDLREVHVVERTVTFYE